MDWNAIGAVGEAVGALAVVITLIYFSQQIRGMKAGTYLQALANTESADLELRKLDAEHAETIVKGNAGKELSDAEQYQIKSVYDAHAGFAFHYHLLEIQSDSPRHVRAMTFAKTLSENPAFLHYFRSTSWPTPEWKHFESIVEKQLQAADDA